MVLIHVGADKPQVVMATVITSYAMSAVLTGLIFLVLSFFKLGDLVSFFPRSILLGCIGGVGVFLFLTGLEVSAGLDSNLDWNLEVLQRLFSPPTLVLWAIPLFLAILLMVIRHYLTHPIVMPAFFIAVVGIFYIVLAAIPSLTLQDLQENGWVFAAPEAGVPFWNFYTYYSKCYQYVITSNVNCLQISRSLIGKPYLRRFRLCLHFHSLALSMFLSMFQP